MPSPNAAPSGTFKIGGELSVHRLGFGAMRLFNDDRKTGVLANHIMTSIEEGQAS